MAPPRVLLLAACTNNPVATASLQQDAAAVVADLAKMAAKTSATAESLQAQWKFRAAVPVSCSPACCSKSRLVAEDLRQDPLQDVLQEALISKPG